MQKRDRGLIEKEMICSTIDSDVPAKCFGVRHYNAHSSIYANFVVRRGEDFTIGICMDELPTTPVFISWGNTTPANFLPAQAEWQRWRDQTIQSLWKGIYITPFLFLGDNGEERQ